MEGLNIVRVYLKTAAGSVQLAHPAIGDVACTRDGTTTIAVPVPRF